MLSLLHHINKLRHQILSILNKNNCLLHRVKQQNDDNMNNNQICINSLSNVTENLIEQNDIELTQSSNDSSNNEQTLLTSPINNGERKRSLFHGSSTHSIRTSTSSLHKTPVYAKVIKSKINMNYRFISYVY